MIASPGDQCQVFNGNCSIVRMHADYQTSPVCIHCGTRYRLLPQEAWCFTVWTANKPHLVPLMKMATITKAGTCYYIDVILVEGFQSSCL